MPKRWLYTLAAAGTVALVGAASGDAATPRVLVFHPDTAGHPEVSAGIQAISDLGRQGGYRAVASAP